MRILKNSSIKTRLMILAVIPITVILALSIGRIFYDIGVKENMQITKNRITEVESLASAIHFLQIERGLSVGFTASQGKKNGDMLPGIRTKADEAINNIKTVYVKTHGDASVLNNLNSLNQKRDSIDSLSMTGSEVAAYYTKTIISFIDAAVVIPTLMNDTDGRNAIQAYTHLASTKESLGQIRALLNKAFIANTMNQKDYAMVVSRELVFTVNKKKFETLSPKELQEFFNNTFRGDSV